MPIPRLEYHDLPEEVRVALAEKFERLGYLGEFFQVAAHQPTALARFVEFTEEVNRALSDDLSQIVALTVAVATENVYERNQHERLALKQGFTLEWLRDVERLEPNESSELDARQRAVQTLVLSMVSTLGRHSSADIEAVERHLDVKEVVAVLLSACRYVGHTAVVRTLGIGPPVSSPLWDN